MKKKLAGYMMHRLGNGENCNMVHSKMGGMSIEIWDPSELPQPLLLLGIPRQSLSANQGNISNLGAKDHAVLPAPNRSIEMLT